MDFTHLHIHSEYSLLDSTCRIERLVERAKTYGMSALAITDTNVLYGAVPFYKACLKAGIHPIIGMVVRYQMRGSDSLKNKGKLQRNYAQFTLLAQTNEGYKNLVKISTHLQFQSEPYMDWEFLEAHAKGLLAFSGGVHGEIESNLIYGKREDAKALARFFRRIFKANFYLELERNGQTFDERRLGFQRQLGQELNIETIVTHNVHYIDPEEALAHQALKCIRSGEVIGAETYKEKMGHNYFKSGKEMADLFPNDLDAVHRTTQLPSSCQVTFDFDQTYLPKYPVPNGGCSRDFLKQLCQKGLEKRYGTPQPNVLDRLNYELAIIDRMGFNDYFLVIWDVVRFARNQGIEPGPGRGSAAGSLVAYVLGITDVDPIHHQLLFERFLNPERISMPDIDLDFPDLRRDEILQYVKERYGQTHVAQIGTFGTLSTKAALRDLGRVLSMKPRDLDRLINLIPNQHGVSLKDAYELSQPFRQLIEHSESYKTLFSLAQMIEGLPRHTSIHAAGVIINAFPLTELVPLQEGREGLSVTQFPMDVLESLGLIKMDFLGLRNLTLIDQILKLIESEGQAPPKLTQIPLEDPNTFKMLSIGETDGVFQLESSGMRDVLKKLRPTSFEDIVAVCALYRPGPMQNIPSYIEGKHGKRKVDTIHPDLAPILMPTYGVIVYQEQIMQIASVMAGFSLGEADLLRRAVSKKKREILEKEKQHFLSGAKNKGYSEELAVKVYNWIVRFADYGFNRSHAVAYGLIAYRLAYLKAHYPAPFITALLTSVGHQPEKLSEYKSLLSKMGLVLLPPSINKSKADFTADPKGVRFGLSGIKHIGMPAVKEILEARKKGDFRSLLDLCKRVNPKKVTRRSLESLIMSGALDEFGQDRASLLASLDLVVERAEEYYRNKQKGQTSFITDDEQIAVGEVPPFRFEELLAMEKEMLGQYVSAHPTTTYQKSAAVWGAKLIRDTETGKARLGVLIESLKMIKTKKGQQMAFGRFSDESGDCEAVIFPNTLETYRTLLTEGALLFAEGSLEYKEGTGDLQFILDKVIPLSDLTPQKAPTKNHNDKSETELYLRLAAREPDMLQKIKDWLKAHPGPTSVFLYFADRKETVSLSESYKTNVTADALTFFTNLLGADNVAQK